ncbi:MAG: hypothetical protein JOY69_09730, partial [Candidatus Eremiobacteraeota bacterium]|nr:hypothetical protein [Candidatus Eremiobacteraeota bacterium]
IVFFVNWVAWDRERRGCRGPLMQAVPALVGYGAAIARRVQGGSEMAGSGTNGETPLNLFADVMRDLTPAKFLRACVDENDRYMRAFDPNLLRPRVIPTLGRMALTIFETIDTIRAVLRRGEARA